MSDTIGAQYPQPDDRGWLVFESLPPDLQRAEDATQYADIGRRYGWIPMDGCYPADWQYDSDSQTWYFDRPATDTEQQLLVHLGYVLPVEGDDGYPLQTRVSYRAGNLRCRRWPALETTT